MVKAIELSRNLMNKFLQIASSGIHNPTVTPTQNDAFKSFTRFTERAIFREGKNWFEAEIAGRKNAFRPSYQKLFIFIHKSNKREKSMRFI